MGATAAEGGSIAGAGLSAYGAISSAQDQASLDREKASVALAQSDEIAQREAANENLRDQQAYRAKMAFGAAFAGSGKSGTGIGSQLEIQRQTDLQNMISNRDSSFQESMLKEQAGVDTALANETITAGYLNAAGSLLGGASRAASIGAGSGARGTQGFNGNQAGV